MSKTTSRLIAPAGGGATWSGLVTIAASVASAPEPRGAQAVNTVCRSGDRPSRTVAALECCAAMEASSFNAPTALPRTRRLGDRVGDVVLATLTGLAAVIAL